MRNIKKLAYDRPAVNTLMALKKQKKVSHIERIRARCLALKIDPESQADVQSIHQSPPLFSVKISGMELEGFEPHEGYSILFTVTENLVTILSIELENPFTQMPEI